MPTQPRPKLSPALREPVKGEILQILRDVARRKRETITYSGLLAKLTTAELGLRHPALYQILCEISREEDAADRGMLSAVMVCKRNPRLPGSKFFELAEELGRVVTARRAMWDAEMERVHAANAPTRRP